MKKRIIIKGKVHDVGYRLFLLNEAEYLHIPGFEARNINIDGEEALIVLVEGEKEQIEEFVEFVKTYRPESAVVDEIKVEDYTGKVGDVESFRNSFNTIQLSKIVQVGLKMLEKQDRMLEKQDRMLEKQDKMLEKQDSMLEKQDETIKTIRKESEKTREEIGGKIDLLRTDLKDYMESNLKIIKEEIFEIKEALKKAGIM